MPSIPVVSASDSPARVVACLERDGAVVVSGVIDRGVRDSILRELAPHLEIVDPDASINKKYAEDGGAANFYPGKTKRITALVARSETFRTFVTHPLMRSACDAILKPNCVHYQVHATAALKIGPGAREQVLHREEDPYQFFKVPRPRMIVASMWAITDFTEANGGTKIVPGSHLWPAERVARPDEVVAAAMPAGIGPALDGRYVAWRGRESHRRMALRCFPFVFARMAATGRESVHRCARRDRAHAFKGGARAGRLPNASWDRIRGPNGQRQSR